MGVDIQTYRCRIGSFCIKNGCKGKSKGTSNGKGKSKGISSSDGGSARITEVKNGYNRTITILVVLCANVLLFGMYEIQHGVTHSMSEYRMLSKRQESLKRVSLDILDRLLSLHDFCTAYTYTMLPHVELVLHHTMTMFLELQETLEVVLPDIGPLVNYLRDFWTGNYTFVCEKDGYMLRTLSELKESMKLVVPDIRALIKPSHIIWIPSTLIKPSHIIWTPSNKLFEFENGASEQPIVAEMQFAKYVIGKIKIAGSASNKITVHTVPGIVQHFRSDSDYEKVAVIDEEQEFISVCDVNEIEFGYVWEDTLPLSLIRIRLMISGVEPNPGPEISTVVEASTKHLEDVSDTASCDSCAKDVTTKGTTPCIGPTREAKTKEKLNSIIHDSCASGTVVPNGLKERKSYVGFMTVKAKVNTSGDVFDSTNKKSTADARFGKALPCTGSVKVGSFWGTQVFKIELDEDLRNGLLNKNKKKDQEFAISRILHELCTFGEFLELETPPLFYFRKRNAYLVLTSASSWKELDITAVNAIPTAVLAYRNMFRQSYFCQDKETIYSLDKHILNGKVFSINFFDIKVTNPFGGFHMISCNCTSIYPNFGKEREQELNYPTQVSEAQQQPDRSMSEDEASTDEPPSTGLHNSFTSEFVNQNDSVRLDRFSDSAQPVQTDRLLHAGGAQFNFNMAVFRQTGVESNPNHCNTERFQDMAPSFKRQQTRYTTAKYSSYEDVVSRRETYRGWPLPQPDPNTLCDAGFFFTGHSYDLVRCFCCGIGLKDFSDTDNPLLEHVKHSANCPFMLGYFGSREALETYKQRYTLQDPEEIRRRQRELYQQHQGRPITNYRAKHERFRTLSSRLGTFIHWPLHLSQRPEQLAEAGMYYTGVDDHCRCFACDGGLRKWEPGDDPWIEHCRWFPACPYAREIKGDEFITLIQLSADQVAGETASNQHDEVNGAMAALSIDDRLIHRIVERHRNMLHNDMGFPVDDIRNAILELVQQGTREPDIEDIVTRLEVIFERKAPDAQFITQQPPCPQSTEALMEQNQRLKSLLLCHLCHNNQVNALFLPCTHHKYCLDCTKHRDRCPDCGRPIKERIRTFMG